MPRKKKAEAAQVADNLSLVFLQRRYDMLLRDMDALRARGIVEIPNSEAQEELLAQVHELAERVTELESERDTAIQAKKDAEEKLETEESRNVELEGEKEELETSMEERFQLLVQAEGALRAVLGREDLDDSIDKFNAFRVLDDLSDEIG